MMPGKLFLFVFLLLNIDAFAQKELKIVAPSKEVNSVSYSQQFITGVACLECKLYINEKEIKVYKTGAFAFSAPLILGENIFKVKVINGKKEVTKTVIFNYSIPEPTKPVTTNNIEFVKTFPAGNLILSPGDVITFEVKALPGSAITVMGQQLYETSGKMPGIYRGEYVVKASDNFRNIKPLVLMRTKDGIEVKKEGDFSFTVMNSMDNDVVITKGRLPYLLFGLGDDRLGGAKIGYLDSLIKLKVIGKVGINYKVKLAPNRTAYIEDDLVDVAPKGELYTTSLTNKWNIYGDGKNDFIQIPLSTRLPYQSMQMVAPSKIIVDIFGAISNTNWITVLNSAKEITNVSYEQISDEVLRIIINLKHVQHWGHSVYYSGNTLIIRVRNQPQSLALNDLTIAVDAGHGGTNTGAV
ncbi:MAG: AMIN domain-containing protein, partial [Ferruginibacter sp.]